MWRTQRLSLGVSWLLQSGHTYWMNSEAMMVMDVVEDSDCRKIFEYPFSTSDFFLGEQCAPQRQMVGYFLSKNLSIIVHHIRQIYQIWSNLSCWGSRWHQAVVLILWILVKKTKFTRWDSEYYRQDGANKNHGWDHHKHLQWSKVYRGLWRKNWATKTWNAAWKQMWSSGIYYI